MGVQELLRREWGPFRGLYNSNLVGSAVPLGYAKTADSCRLDNSVLEVGLGNTYTTPTFAVNGSFTAGVASTYSRYAVTLPAEQFGLSADRYVVANSGLILLNGTTSLSYSTGTVTVTNGSATVTGSGTSWTSNFPSSGTSNYQFIFRLQSQTDADWVSVSALDSNTQITLDSNWAGSTLAGQTYYLAVYIKDSSFPATSNTQQTCMAVMEGKMLLSDGTSTVLVYDGSNISFNSTAPKVKCFAVHKNRLFGASTNTAGTSFYWSPVGQPNGSWDTSNAVSNTYSDAGGPIVQILSWKNRLFLFKRSNGIIYEVFGDFSTPTGAPDSVIKITQQDDIGTLFPWSVCIWKDIIWFFTTTGLYSFDGSSIQKFTYAFDGYFSTQSILTASSGLNEILLKVSAIPFNDNLIVNLNGANFIIDQNKSVVRQALQTSETGPRGKFCILRSSSTNASNSLIAPFNEYGAAVLMTGLTRIKTDGTTTANVNNNLVYEIGDDYLDSLEYMKDFYKFYVVYEETSGTNSFDFQYDINNTGTYSTATTVTTTGTSGLVKVAEIPVYARNDTSNSRGRCIRWKITGKNTAVNFKVFKVVLRYTLLSLR